MDATLEVIKITTYILFVYLLLSIIVERVIEILVAIYNYLEFQFKWDGFWNAKAEKYRRQFERLYGFQGKSSGNVSKLFNWILWKTITEKPYEGGKDVISAGMIRLNYIRFVCRVLAFGLSLIFVLWQHLDFVALVETMIPDVKRLTFITQFGWVRVLISAGILAIGTEPLHQLINKLETLEKKRKKPATGGTQ